MQSARAIATRCCWPLESWPGFHAGAEREHGPRAAGGTCFRGFIAVSQWLVMSELVTRAGSRESSGRLKKDITISFVRDRDGLESKPSGPWQNFSSFCIRDRMQPNGANPADRALCLASYRAE
jgi:hypothetical protein